MLAARAPLSREMQAACMTAKVANSTDACGSPSLCFAALFDFFKLGMLLVATYQFNVNSGAQCISSGRQQAIQACSRTSATGLANACIHCGTCGTIAASPKFLTSSTRQGQDLHDMQCLACLLDSSGCSCLPHRRARACRHQRDGPWNRECTHPCHPHHRTLVF